MEKESRRPKDNPFNQQKMVNLSMHINLFGYITIFLLMGIILIPMGVFFHDEIRDSKEYVVTYDGPGVDSNCSITASEIGSKCNLTIEFTEDMTGPVYFYYQLENFYQNHFLYEKSYDYEQLMGSNLDYDELYSSCYPIIENDSLVLNPCGLVANTFFSDVFILSTGTEDIELDTEGIAWADDIKTKYKQPDGFTYKEVKSTKGSCVDVLGEGYEDCKVYHEKALEQTYYFWYPDDDTTQYLYETFPEIISPLKGVEDERFINWMRMAGLPSFRKLYGKVDVDVDKGTLWNVTITLNYPVKVYDISKSIVISDMSTFGSRNFAVANTYIGVGCVCLIIGFLLSGYQIIKT